MDEEHFPLYVVISLVNADEGLLYVPMTLGTGTCLPEPKYD